MTQTQPDTSRPNPSDITTKTTVDTANSAKVDKSTLVRKGDIYATAHDDAVTKMGSGSDSNALTAGPPEGIGVKSVNPADTTMTIVGTDFNRIDYSGGRYNG